MVKRRQRFAVESVSRWHGRRVAWIRDQVQDRTIGIYLQGTRLLIWDGHYDRPKQPVANPTLRKVAMEVLG